MLYQLIMLEKYRDCGTEISLDDSSSGSKAVYRLKNPEGLEVSYCCPDKAESVGAYGKMRKAAGKDRGKQGKGREKQGKGRETERREPRCDYLVYVAQIKLVKFVELKGTDSGDTGISCCATSWEHGFHQLDATYEAYHSFLDQKDVIHFILCTTLPRNRINSRYRSYTRYRRLREKAASVLILGSDEWDELSKVNNF